MHEPPGLQVDEHEALEQVVIEDEVDVEIIKLGADVLLAGDERIALAHLEQELLQVGDDCALELRLPEVAVG